MSSLPTMTEPPPTGHIELAGRQRLTIHRANNAGGEDILELTGADGTLSLLLRVGPEGTRIELGAASLAMRVAGEMSIDAEEISLNGRKGISLTTGGAMTLKAGAVLKAEGESMTLSATLGDVMVYANDDVKVDGERIRMNC